MSVSDKSKKKCDRLDVDDAIKHALGHGSKSPRELKEAVIDATQVSRRVYYRHLKKLGEKKIIKEVSEENSVGCAVKKYALTDSLRDKILPAWRPSLAEVPKNVWELVAWIRYSPQGWPHDDEDIKKAHGAISEYESFVDFPKIKKYSLDPDRYVINWPNVFKKELKIGIPLPRFFNLKSIYQAKLNKDETDQLTEDASFLGVKEFVDDNGTNRQIAVIVRKKLDNKLEVSRLEVNLSHSKQWIKSLCKEHNVKGVQVIHGSQELGLIRQAIFHLDSVLNEQRLLIPSNYSLLLRDLKLFNFSYTPLPEPRNRNEKSMLQEYKETAGNFVHALATSVSYADNLTIK